MVLAGGAEWPRDLEVPGRELAGIHFAMDFLTQQNKRVAGDDEARAAPKGTLTAKGKHVVVIGGGDTGSDCVGTSNRQGAASVTQLEIMPQPPEHENKALTWPDWPLKLRTSSSHEEGVERDFAVLTKRAVGKDGKVDGAGMRARRVGRRAPTAAWRCRKSRAASSSSRPTWCCWPWASSARASPAWSSRPASTLDPRGNVAANIEDYKTSVPKLFACGDMRRGQSLVVWAIREGRQCARVGRRVPDGHDDPAALALRGALQNGHGCCNKWAMVTISLTTLSV